MEEEENCIFCGESLGEGVTVTITDKGLLGITKASKERRTSELHATVGQMVHRDCRAKFINPKNIKLELQSRDKDKLDLKKLRSTTKELLEYGSKCLFCDKLVTCIDLKDKRAFTVRSLDFDTSIRNVCEERKDEWSTLVKGRIQNVNDLHAADAVYHQLCSSNFRTGRDIPMKYRTTANDDNQSPSGSNLGRPVSDVRFQAFLQVVEYLRSNDEEQTTLQTLVDKMKEYLNNTDEEPYSSKYMRLSLLTHFQNDIVINTVNTVPNVVTFRKTADRVLGDFYINSKEDINSAKMKLLTAAAEILRSDIKGIATNTDVYPSSNSIASLNANIEYLPDTLTHFLRNLMTGKNVDIKVAALGQALMQSVRPRVLIPPLQLGLAVEVHHNYNSKFLVNSLHKLGFASSYAEVQQFEKSAAVQAGTDIPGLDPRSHIQYIADNVDHNTVTLDGKGTFHGMGIIAAVTPNPENDFVVTRRRSVTLNDLQLCAPIPIHTYSTNESGMMKIKFESLSPLLTDFDQTRSADMLWNISRLLKTPRPAWNGFMQMVHKGDHPGKSGIVFLPMIAMDPGNETCIYSTLHFIADHAHRYNVTPVVTFDQPLWWKAFGIVQNESPSSRLGRIVLRIAGLHAQMSFLGTVGTLMAGSGLGDILRKLYAENVVQHILSGHAIARAIRAHIIIFAAL